MYLVAWSACCAGGRAAAGAAGRSPSAARAARRATPRCRAGPAPRCQCHTVTPRAARTPRLPLASVADRPIRIHLGYRKTLEI